MPESTALVPVPLYAPVRTGIGSFFMFGELSRRPLLLEQPVGTVSPEPDEGAAYSRDGRFLADTRIGMLVNIYV